ncbi:trypsin-like peptidase domain-containing protein [Streptomyces sp. NPDC003688]
MHEPDPYSTPPYGEPGPWAPAPPFQGPGVTPAHGTPYVPSQAPYPTADAVPSQAPYPTVDALPDPAHEIHAHQTHAAPPHVPQPQLGQAHVPQPQLGQAHVPQPQLGQAHVPQPQLGQAHAPQPQLGQAHAPQPQLGQAHAPQPQLGQAHAPQPHLGQAHAAPPHAPQPHAAPPHPAPVDSWQRYDPWAVPNLQQADPVMPAERTSRGKVLLGWGLAVVLVAGGLGGFAGAWVERAGIGDVHLPQAAKVPAGRAPGSVAGIAARALPSVVTLHVSGDDEAGTGTGFVLDTRGHILTNNHVVAPASSGGEITVTFSTGDTARARVVGRDSGYDLAVVQVSGVRGLTPLALGDSDDVRVGDPVVAIGAPFDLANTVTSGIISAKERPITAGGEKGDGSDISYVDALQTDAPINPGNSGGPLLDAHAQVIGINSAIRSAGSDTDSGESQAGSIGLGFAIPANQARRVAEELINEGHATHPVIGVTLDMGYTGDAARVSAKGGTGGPAVQPGGPGDRAGLKAGDLVTEVDGHRVHSGEELIVKIRAHQPGDRLRLTVERAGAERVVSLVLGASERN